MTDIDLAFEAQFGKEVPELGLARIQRFLEQHPVECDQHILVVGTNGKGTCSHWIATGLQQAGHRVLQFGSPHLYSITERIRLNNEVLADRYWEDQYDYLVRWCKANVGLTYFEAVFALAWLAVRDHNVDYAVWEAGLGGRYDAVNAIAHVACCVCTSIGLDHQKFLGSSLKGIMHEKLAIVRRAVPFVCALPEELASEGRNYIQKRKGIFLDVDSLDASWEDFADQLSSQYPNIPQINARTVAKTLQTLDVCTPESLAPDGFVPLPGRCEEVEPNIWFDVAHNAQALGHLGQFLGQMTERGMKVYVILRLLKRKSLPDVAAALSAWPIGVHIAYWKHADDQFHPHNAFWTAMAGAKRQELEPKSMSEQDLISLVHAVRESPGQGLVVAGSFQLRKDFDNMLEKSGTVPTFIHDLQD